MIRELSYLLGEAPFIENQDTWQFKDHLRAIGGESGDKKQWMGTGNDIFSVKSFYNFLNDGGLRCPIAKFFWRNSCSRKINLFN